VSTPRGLAFDTDTESKDAWSVSMATPLSKQVNLDEVDETAASTSNEDLCSSLSSVEHSSVEHGDLMGEMISQTFVVKQQVEKDDCHRTPLTVSMIQKLYSKHFVWRATTCLFININTTIL